MNIFSQGIRPHPTNGGEFSVAPFEKELTIFRFASEIADSHAGAVVLANGFVEFHASPMTDCKFSGTSEPYGTILYVFVGIHDIM